ncbi:hypothetical protein GCM10010124_24310 [Pilimelia terevasa]|uniref:DUF4383 domain-containing protein n=1 Tax=Pilimelia terevasa TaxID=53372 RepID=A0A8J3BLY0_9ACTN|nr:DUF4383 domain-containing protein [Pilimelia terevasa]GGK30730.1 hypothetical protein GCM10010124_24310 [Pilimelia terevasa]
MLHMPINHPLSPLFRTVAGLVGGYVFAFGTVGVLMSWGTPFFGREDIWALGLRTNPAFAVLSLFVGAVVLAGAVLGGQFAHWVNLAGGAVFLVAGVAMLGFMQTSANLLNFSVGTCVVSYLVGMAMLLAGLYDRVGSPTEAAAEEAFRQRRGMDHSVHPWTTGEYPHRPTDGARPDGSHRFA